jgi:hypothetical protein
MMSRKILAPALLLAASSLPAEAFSPRPRPFLSRRETTSLRFGIPSFFTPKEQGGDDDGDKPPQEEKKIGMGGLVQLITAGMGAPFLGDYQGVDEETGKMMFTLEANNLVDEKGRSKQTQMPYFESGWVDPEDERRAAEGFKLPWQK